MLDRTRKKSKGMKRGRSMFAQERPYILKGTQGRVTPWKLVSMVVQISRGNQKCAKGC